jgi:hypothetical protein
MAQLEGWPCLDCFRFSTVSNEVYKKVSPVIHNPNYKLEEEGRCVLHRHRLIAAWLNLQGGLIALAIHSVEHYALRAAIVRTKKRALTAWRFCRAFSAALLHSALLTHFQSCFEELKFA